MSVQLSQPVVTLKGRLIHSYRGAVPGWSRLYGMHCFLDPATASSSTIELSAERNQLSEIGFWILDEDSEKLELRKGENLTVDVVLQAETPLHKGLILLVPGVSSITVEGRESLENCTNNCEADNHGLPADYPQLHIGYGFFSSISSYGADLMWAAGEWNAHSGTQISVFSYIEKTVAHYHASFDNIPADKAALTEIGPPRPGQTSDYRMRFGNHVEWSAPGETPRGTQRNFRSTALHEIGHAMGLRHICGSGHIMSDPSRQDAVLSDRDISCMRALVGR